MQSPSDISEAATAHYTEPQTIGWLEFWESYGGSHPNTWGKLQNLGLIEITTTSMCITTAGREFITNKQERWRVYIDKIPALRVMMATIE